MLQITEKPKTISKQRAYVMINCEEGGEQLVIEQLKKIDEIREVQSTFGSYDIITKIETSSIETLREVIALKVRKIPKVRTTTTIVCEPINLLNTNLTENQ